MVSTNIILSQLLGAEGGRCLARALKRLHGRRSVALTQQALINAAGSFVNAIKVGTILIEIGVLGGTTLGSIVTMSAPLPVINLNGSEEI